MGNNMLQLFLPRNHIQINNSAALRLPAALLEQLNAEYGDKLTVEMQSDGMFLKPKTKKYSLDELLSQCDLKSEAPKWSC